MSMAVTSPLCVVSRHYMQRKLKVQSVSFLSNTIALKTFMKFLDFTNVNSVRDYETNLLILHTFNLSSVLKNLWYMKSKGEKMSIKF
jgi:quinol-cytochrome oxidoreductase complex cytochrome b subunit